MNTTNDLKYCIIALIVNILKRYIYYILNVKYTFFKRK